MRVYSFWAIAAQSDIALLTGGVPTQVNPADVPSRPGRLSFHTEPSEDLAPLNELFSICDFPWVLSQHATRRQNSFDLRALEAWTMYASGAKTWKLGRPESPRRVLMRFGLEHALKEADMELNRLVRPPEASDAAQSFDLITLLRSRFRRPRRPWPTIGTMLMRAIGFRPPKLTKELLNTTK